MDPTSILTKTAKGSDRAKIEGSNINYDAVRVLRLVDGKATVAQLRSKFSDLTDSRFQKAAATLHEKKLVEFLAAPEGSAGEHADMSKLDEKSQEIAQEVVLTLDFTKLQRGLLKAVQESPPAAAVANAQQPKADKSPAAPPGAATDAKARPSREATDIKASAKLAAEQKPKVEAELRAKLLAALRPKIEEELRQKLVAALRPALEAEIRAKLTAALVPRVAHELRSRLTSPLANAAAETGPDKETAAAAGESAPHARLLECLREGVFQTDSAGTSVYVNARWLMLSGHRREDILGKPFAQCFVPEDQQGVADYLDGVARGGAVPLIFEAHLARKGATPLRVAIRAAVLTADSSDCAGVCGTMRGMTA